MTQQVSKEIFIAKLINFLCEHGSMEEEHGLKMIAKKQPNHGSCCTCQDCGREFGECVCQHNTWVKFIEDNK